jgi:very-short-patch-repair endonuclease
MLRALIAVFQGGYLGELSILSAKAFLAVEEPPQFQLLPFACQVPIGEYRVDFAMLVAAEPQYLLVIECDGHEFHERTKEQAQRDKARDRALQSQNLKIFRFTGSEIWCDPIACAREVYRMVETDIFDAARNDRSPT